ncbi:hypothetical protein KJ953_00425 [Patescibacteria group bacterium]|nr:hypothetical protein [Patescibacteria group bacterium]MBU1256657.1 hypothetical protein [Patescibacteria group bacterium]MBU1457851.1 hypothetical protein [Patescibacteria group bacterium]
MHQLSIANQIKRNLSRYLNCVKNKERYSIKGWLETLEILSNKSLTASIKAGLKDIKEKNIVSQEQAYR